MNWGNCLDTTVPSGDPEFYQVPDSSALLESCFCGKPNVQWAQVARVRPGTNQTNTSSSNVLQSKLRVHGYSAYLKKYKPSLYQLLCSFATWGRELSRLLFYFFVSDTSTQGVRSLDQINFFQPSLQHRVHKWLLFLSRIGLDCRRKISTVQQLG